MKRWTSRAGVRELQHDLRSLKIRTAESVLAAARRFMSRTDEFCDLLRDFSAAAADNPFFRPHFLLLASDVPTSLLLSADPHAPVSMVVTSANPLPPNQSGGRRPGVNPFS